MHLRYGFSSIRLKALTSAGAEFGPVGYELNLLYIAALLTLALSALVNGALPPGAPEQKAAFHESLLRGGQ